MLFCLIDRKDELTSWIEKYESQPTWNTNVIKRLFQISIDLCEKIKTHEEIYVSKIFCSFVNLPQPKYDLHRINSGLIRAIKETTKEVLTISYYLKIKFSEDPNISEEDLGSIQFSTWLNRENFLEWMLSNNEPVLAEAAFTEYLTNELEFWKHNVVPFSERAEHYIKLATLCRHHQSRKYEEILKLGARNLVAYGYHKDVFLDHIIESIRICHRKQSPRILQWIKEIEQPVDFILEYTDGDTTRDFPMTFANLLGEIDPQLLYKNYFYLIQNEDFDSAEHLFADILSVLDYDKEIHISIASTALDNHSFKTLQSLSENGNFYANNAKSNLEGHFGPLVFPNEETMTSEILPQKLIRNYDQVSYDTLAEHLQSIDGYWESEEYLDGWIKYQLAQLTPTPKAIYDTIVKITLLKVLLASG